MLQVAVPRLQVFSSMAIAAHSGPSWRMWLARLVFACVLVSGLVATIWPRLSWAQPCPSGPGCDGWTTNFRGEGVAGPEHVVVTEDGELYAYGRPMLTTTGYVWNGVVRWNGSDWEAVAALEGSVTGLYAGPRSTLYVVGTFSRLGYSISNAVAAWDGSDLEFLGAALADPPKVLALSPDGDLYVGGGTRTGGPFRTPLVHRSTEGLMRWDGMKWRPSGGWSTAYSDQIAIGPDGTVYASVNNGEFCLAWIPQGEDQFACFASGRAGSMAVDSEGTLYATELSGSRDGVPLRSWADGQPTGTVLEGVLEVIGREGEIWALVARDSLEVLHLQGESWVAAGPPFAGSVSDISASQRHGVVVAGAIHRGSGPVETTVHLLGDEWNPIRDSTPRLGLTDQVGEMHAMAGSGALLAIEYPDRSRIDSTQIAAFRDGSWTILGRAFRGGYSQISALFGDSPEEVFVSGTFQGRHDPDLIHLARWDGTAWQEMEDLPAPFTDGKVLDFTRDVSGRLIVAGEGAAGQGFVLRWNRPGWTVLTSVAGSVSSVEAHPEGWFAIGGDFASPGLSHVARLDDSGLSALGREFSRPPGDLVIHDGGVVALDNAQDLVTGFSSKALRWDGSAWEEMGGRFSGKANLATQLAVDGEGQLYVAGRFRWAGLAEAHGIARWDGSAWAAIPGVSGEMGDLVNYDGRPKDFWSLSNAPKMSVGLDGTLYLGFTRPLNYTGGTVASGFSVWYPEGVPSSDQPSREVPSYSVYPNPTVGRIRISGSPPPRRVSVYDAIGRRKGVHRWDSAFPDLTLDLSTTSPGVYFLVVESALGRQTVPVIVR